MTPPAGPTSYNSDILESNKSILRRRFPQLSMLIDVYGGNRPPSIHPQTSRSGLPTVVVRNDGVTTTVHSTFEPVVEAQRWVKEPLERDWDFAVVFGMGLGYHLDALLEQRPHSRLVVIEPSLDVFYAALALKDQGRLLSHPHVAFIVTENAAAAASEVFGRHLRELLGEAPMFVWPAADRYAKQFLQTFQSQLVDRLRAARGNLATEKRYHLQWIANFFKNVGHAAADPGVVALKGRLEGRPAIIAAAGPSLEKNAHLLKKAKGKAVLIAAGSAINPLLKHGVEPDLLVSFDAGRANYSHFKHLRAPELPLVYVPTIYPQIVAEYEGPRFAAAMDVFPFIEWVFGQLEQDKGLLVSGPSVANVSWDLANRLGSNPIVLVGQDLAFTDAKTHAAGTTHAKTVNLESPESTSGYLVTEGIDGDPVVTDGSMYTMKVWFENQLAHGPTERMTIDATEGGAKIGGAIIMDLQDVLDTYCVEAFDPYATIMSIHKEQLDQTEPVDVHPRLDAIFRDLRVQTAAVQRGAREGLRDAHRLMRESNTRRLSEQRLKEAVRRLGRHGRRMGGTPVYELFIEPVTGHVIQAIALLMQARQEMETDLHARGAEVSRQYEALFTAARDVARHLERQLAEQKLTEQTRNAPTSEAASDGAFGS